MSRLCPCCGSTLKSSGLLVDLSSNIISIGDSRTRVAPRVAEMVSVLANASPQYVASENLAARVWGQAHAKQKSPGIRTHVREIRRILAPLGYGVQNARGGFYRIVPAALIVPPNTPKPRTPRRKAVALDHRLATQGRDGAVAHA